MSAADENPLKLPGRELQAKALDREDIETRTRPASQA